jgi:hypothetical protein
VIGWNGEKGVMDVMQRVSVDGAAIVGLRQQMVAIDDANGARVDSSVSLVREDAADEWPIAIEEAAGIGVDDVLQYCKNVRVLCRFACERGEVWCGAEFVHILIRIVSFENQ